MSTPEGPTTGGQHPTGQQHPGQQHPGQQHPGQQHPGHQPPPFQQPVGGAAYPPGQQPYAGGDPGYGHQGPGMQERAAQAFQTVSRHVRTPETKEFFKTSEFAVWVITVLGLLIAGASIGGGNDDEFPASVVWTLVTALSFAYIISRGISKAGTRRGDGDGHGGGPRY